MRKFAFILLAAAGVTLLALFVGRLAPSSGNASSHREAPLISEDPTADNTDLYAFRSPDKPDTLTIIANWIPGEDPAAGPNYYTFSQTARYLIYIDRNGDGKPDITYNFQFKTPTGPVLPRQHAADLDGEAQRQGVRQRQDADQQHRPALQRLRRGQGLRGRRAGDDRHEGRRLDLRRPARRPVLRRRRRDLRPRRVPQGGHDREQGRRQGLPLRLQRPHDRPADPDRAGRHQEPHDRRLGGDDRKNVTVNGQVCKGWTQVSRLGNPLINEVVIPTGLKDLWNRTTPAQDAQFKKYYETPILAAVMNKLYKLGVPETGRDDLVAVLGTGIPKVTFTGNTFADELRINLAVPVTAASPNRMGVLGGDNGGFPNGRRLADDIVDIEEQAVAGFLKGKKVPLGDGVDANDMPFLAHFPYVADPARGLRELEGDQLGEHRREGARRARAPIHRPEPRMTNKLLIGTAAVSPPASPPSSAACSTGPRPPRRRARRPSQSVEDFKAGFALNASTASLVASLQATLAREPEGRAHAGRCSASPTSSAPARPATRATTPKSGPRSERALELDGDDPLAISGLGSLALSRHRFALRARARRARRCALSPSTARNYGVIGDAQIELGRYREAFRDFDTMNRLKPSLSSYARVSYGRELIGNTAGAIAAMKLAIDAADRHGASRRRGRTSSSASST